MKNFKKLSTFSATMLMVVTMGSAYAEDSIMTQTRTQDRVRSEVNQQTPTSDFAQARLREHKMSQKNNQFRYKNEYRNKFQTQQDDASSMSRQNMQRSSMGGNRR